MSETVEITRYPNRRLYDRSRKQYVTVGDIEAMVLGGRDVRVRDSKSDEDLTRVILTQILLERHPERMKLFPVAVLHAILRADRMALNWLAIYFGQALSFMEEIKRAPGLQLVPGMNLWRSLLTRGASSPRTAEAEPVQQDEFEDRQELADKLAEMERRLKQLESDSVQDSSRREG